MRTKNMKFNFNMEVFENTKFYITMVVILMAIVGIVVFQNNRNAYLDKYVMAHNYTVNVINDTNIQNISDANDMIFIK